MKALIVLFLAALSFNSQALAQNNDLQLLGEVAVQSFISQKFAGYENLSARNVQVQSEQRNSKGQLTKLIVTAEVSDLVADHYTDPEREYNENYRIKTCTTQIAVDFLKKTNFGYDLDFLKASNCKEVPYKP